MRQPLRVDTARACLGEGGSYEIWSHGAPEDPDNSENPRPLHERLGALGLYVVSLAATPEAVIDDLSLASAPRYQRMLWWIANYGETLVYEDKEGEEDGQTREPTKQKLPFGKTFRPATTSVVRVCELHGEAVREAAYRGVHAYGAIAVPVCTESVAWGEDNEDGIGSVMDVGRKQSYRAVSVPMTDEEWIASVANDYMLSVPTLVPGVNAVLHSWEKPELRPDGRSNTIERIILPATSPDGFSAQEVEQG